MKTDFDVNCLVGRIELLCVQNGITKSKLFADCGMSRNTINNLKGGSIPSVDKIASIADYFDVSIDYLLGREESPVRVNGHVNGDNSVQNITDSPVTTIQEPPKQIIADGLTNEFIQVFQGLSFPDKMEVMNLTMQKMQKGA